MVEHRSNPRLSFIKEGCEGNLIIDGRFVNGREPEEFPFSIILKWFITANPQKKEKRMDRYRLKVVEDPELFSRTEDMIVWLGHATFLIRLNGVSILTDPNLSDSWVPKRHCGLACPVDRIENLDHIVISHGHRDHLDMRTIRRVLQRNPDVEFLTPPGLGAVLGKLGTIRIQEAAWYQRYDTPDLDICLLPSQHWHRRGL